MALSKKLASYDPILGTIADELALAESDTTIDLGSQAEAKSLRLKFYGYAGALEAEGPAQPTQAGRDLCARRAAAIRAVELKVVDASLIFSPRYTSRSHIALSKVLSALTAQHPPEPPPEPIRRQQTRAELGLSDPFQDTLARYGYTSRKPDTTPQPEATPPSPDTPPDNDPDADAALAQAVQAMYGIRSPGTEPEPDK